MCFVVVTWHIGQVNYFTIYSLERNIDFLYNFICGHITFNVNICIQVETSCIEKRTCYSLSFRSTSEQPVVSAESPGLSPYFHVINIGLPPSLLHTAVVWISWKFSATMLNASGYVQTSSFVHIMSHSNTIADMHGDENDDYIG